MAVNQTAETHTLPKPKRYPAPVVARTVVQSDVWEDLQEEEVADDDNVSLNVSESSCPPSVQNAVEKPPSTSSELESQTSSSSDSDSSNNVDRAFAITHAASIPSVQNLSAPKLRERCFFHGLWKTLHKAHDSEVGKLKCGRRIHSGFSVYVDDQVVQHPHCKDCFGKN